MNAKTISLLAACAVGGAITWYLVGAGSKEAQESAAPAAAVEADPVPAPSTDLAVPEPEAPVAPPIETIAEIPEVKVIHHPTGDIYLDVQTKTLVQNRKVLFRYGDGRVEEREIVLTAKPIVRPLPIVSRTDPRVGQTAGETGGGLDEPLPPPAPK